MYSWLIKSITDGFVFSANLKRSDFGEVNVYKHKETGQRIIVREIKDGIEVYQKLLSVKSDNLPTIFEVAVDGNKAIVVEEFISGITVGDVLESGHYTEQGLKVVITKVCDALNVLHSLDIVHRDIKPENVMITDEGEVVLIDFNASREYKDDKAKDTHILGTHGFAAPEQYGLGQTDNRTDIYALGVLMNVMLTGEHPSKSLYDGKVSKIIRKCLNANPDERYQDVMQITAELEKIV